MADHECARCRAYFSVELGDEPTKYCHNCAHARVEELETELATANARADRAQAGLLRLRELIDRLLCDAAPLSELEVRRG